MKQAGFKKENPFVLSNDATCQFIKQRLPRYLLPGSWEGLGKMWARKVQRETLQLAAFQALWTGLALTFGEQLPRTARALFGSSSNRGVAACYIISRHEVPGAFFFFSSLFND